MSFKEQFRAMFGDGMIIGHYDDYLTVMTAPEERGLYPCRLIKYKLTREETETSVMLDGERYYIEKYLFLIDDKSNFLSDSIEKVLTDYKIACLQARREPGKLKQKQRWGCRLLIELKKINEQHDQQQLLHHFVKKMRIESLLK